MSRECPECSFTNEAIVSWKKILDKFDMASYFGRRPCSIAKGVFATQAIKKLELREGCALIHACFNGETIDFNIKFHKDLSMETSIDKKKITSQIVTIAALMEIIVLVNSEAANVPQYDVKQVPVRLLKEVQKRTREDQLKNSKACEDKPYYGQKKPQEIEKNVLVKFTIVGNEVVMKAYLDHSEKKPIFMQNSSRVTMVSGDLKKMALLRLLYYARKSKFEFYANNRDYRIKNMRDATELVSSKMPIWERYFFVEIAPEMVLLKRGIVYPKISAKIFEVDPENVRIQWKIETDYGVVDQQHMQELLRANGRAVFVPGMGAVALRDDQIAVIRHVFSNNAHALFKKYMLYVLLNQHALSVDVSECKITHIDVGAVKFPLPEFLKNYQKEGVYAMRAILDAGCHCLLADEMGLGKTLQVLSLICTDTDIASPKTLVVCPASVVFVWQKEIEKFFPDRTTAIVDKFYDFSQELPHFLLCSYAQVHKMQNELKNITFHYVVLDEAQYAKNPRSKTMISCCSLSSRYRVAITGTPIENNLVDIWSIFKFLMPGFFCRYQQFIENIENKAFKEDFKQKLATFMIRRTKQSVAIELPQRNELEIICNMTDGQRVAYESIRKNLRKALYSFNVSEKKNTMNVLTALMRLRQAACAQFILPASLQHDHMRTSNKIDTLMVKLESIAAAGKKAIVFTQFLEFLSEIQSRIQAQIPDTPVHVLRGKTNNRKEVVSAFQNEKGSAIMLVSLKAGGVGITLHAAEYVFLMEPWWNPAVEEQAIARIHRIGQKNITTVYRMITANSIEERMRKIQLSKNELFNEFIKTGHDNIAMANFYLKNLESLLD